MIADLVKAGLGGLEEVELPEWLGEALYSDENGVLIKGAGHKYLRRVPKAGGGWRYFYTVTGGQGLGHHSEMVRGAAFKVKDAGQEGHFHVEEDHGDEVTIKHDETGKTSRVSKQVLSLMVRREHAEALRGVRERAAANLEQARKTGSSKQQERAAALVQKYDRGGRATAQSAAAAKEAKAKREQEEAAALVNNAPRVLLGGNFARKGHAIDTAKSFLRASGKSVDHLDAFENYSSGGPGSIYTVVFHDASIPKDQRNQGNVSEVVRVLSLPQTRDRLTTPDGREGADYHGPVYNIKGEVVRPSGGRATIKAPAGLSGDQFDRLGGARSGKAHWWLRNMRHSDFVDLPRLPGHQDFSHALDLPVGEYTLGVGDMRHKVEVGEGGSVRVNGELVKSLAQLARVF